ncbi:hypothetical protein NVSP9465_02277 [Novosphingobium sp. CECT 9465]|nr:hypothetical protein NVSP9465_02277 [Novosphingobium sp. CECT 9465]
MDTATDHSAGSFQTENGGRPQLSFPLFFIDFEASALTLESFPIEVGIAIARGVEGTIETWSTLIAPDPQWTLDDQWDPDAERVHGIRRWDLRHGLSAVEAMAKLNAFVQPNQIVWCDGGHYDAHWLGTLAIAAGIAPAFRLGDIGTMVRTDVEICDLYNAALASSLPPHRAGPDARRLCETLVRALTRE